MNQQAASKTKLIVVGSLTITIGVLVVLGWILQIRMLRMAFLSESTIRFNSAIAFIFLGIALVLSPYRSNRTASFFYLLCSFLALLLGGVSLLEWVFGWNAGIDEWLVKDIVSRSTGGRYPGLMSPMSAICYMATGAGLLGAFSAKRVVQKMSQYAFHYSSLHALVALFGYLFQVSAFYNYSFFTSIAFPSAVLHFMVSVTASFIHPSLGLTGLFTGNQLGNVMIRRLFPLFVLLFVAIDYLVLLSIRKEILSYPFAIVLSGLVALIVFMILTSRTALKLNQIDAQRVEAENELIGLNMDLEQKVEERSKQLKEANEKLRMQNQILESQNTALQRANEELNSFTRIASHDLKEPLRKVRMYISSIENRNAGELPQIVRDHFGRIAAASEHMTNLIDDLLNFSTLNKEAIAFEEVDLNSILSVSKANLAALITEKKANIQSGSLPVVQAIPFQMQQLFTNLISNALKYSKTDVAPLITITATQQQNLEEVAYHQISFADNGIGFSQQYSDKIFGLFQRLHSREVYNGTGVGLSICKKIVENHNGKITVDSEPDSVSIFTIYLPRHVEQQFLSA